jgi:hypothetical protein
MKRYAIRSKQKEIGYIKFTVPTIEVLHFNSPFFLGSWCADNGTLWTCLDDGKNIFENENEAKERLAEIIKELFA